jgi:hypothetical protein
MRISGANVSKYYQHNLESMILCSYFNIVVWGFCYLRIFKNRHSIQFSIIFNIYLVDLSEQTSKVTATFQVTKTGIISPKAGEKMYRVFTRERKKFLLPAINEIWFVMTENFQSNCNLEGYGKLTGGVRLIEPLLMQGKMAT